MIQSPKNTTVKGTVNQPADDAKDESFKAIDRWAQSGPRPPYTDRQKLNQRRMFYGMSGLLPEHAWHSFTRAEHAVLALIAYQWLRTGGKPFQMTPAEIAAECGYVQKHVEPALQKGLEWGLIWLRPPAEPNGPPIIVLRRRWTRYVEWWNILYEVQVGDTYADEIELYVAPAGDVP